MYISSKISPEGRDQEQTVPGLFLDQNIVEQSAADSSTRRSSTIPTNNILVFDENDPNYFIFTLIHAKKAAIAAGLFGLFGSCVIFGICICYFRWYYYESSVDAIALSGFSVFLISGIFVHSLLLRAINKSKVAFITPFLIFHGFLCLMENIMALTAIGQLVSDQDAHVDESDILAREILLFSPVCICVQALMLYSGLKFREYLKNQIASETALGVCDF